jgi:pimeloyl-ACP methyl ester carboxylesterase
MTSIPTPTPSSTDLPRLVFLPGLLNDGRLWQAQIDGLDGIADCTVGDLTGSRNGADTIAALAASVLEQSPSTHFALAGLSMGGYVALEMMRQAPERILGLALLDTSARPDTPQATEGRRAAMKLSETNFPAVIAALFPKLMLPAHAQNEALEKVFTAMAHDVGPEGYRRQQAAIIGRIDSRPFLGAIHCPTMVLCGRDDAVTPVEVHEEMATAIPGSMLEIVEECGHLSALEQPDRVTESLKRWLLRVVVP